MEALRQAQGEGVSFVVPVHNGAVWIRGTLESILAQADGRPLEVIVVDDRSRDESADILQQIAARSTIVRVIAGSGRGAAAAINTGICAARFPIICQVDQDVELRPGWLHELVKEFVDPKVAAAQGYYSVDPDASVCARVMNLDLEQRYSWIRGDDTTHVCTGNSAYRAEALHRVGLFDETFGYGYDNDISYRLQDAGYRLRFCRTAQSVHRWREGLVGYVVQQYGFGYGRIDLVAKHPNRLHGDSVSPLGMMSHPMLMAGAIASLVAGGVAAVMGGPWPALGAPAAVLIAGLSAERFIAGIGAARRFRDSSALLFPVFHAVRDVAWVAAIGMWSVRRLVRRPAAPSHSMRPRSVVALRSDSGAPVTRRDRTPRRTLGRALCLLPAHNEAANLSAVVDELRRCRPDLDILVVDDGSTDETPIVLHDLGVRWLRLPERMGIGSAMRAGLQDAARLGYQVVVRLDSDGQHRPDDIERLLVPLEANRADVVLGSRFAENDEAPGSAARLIQRLLAACLGALTGKRVTDPTSGFYALGSRAVQLLAEHHPTGYPEPELRLFLGRNALNAVEVPVRGRPRRGGRTSLTAGRLTVAGARVLLAMMIEPMRPRVDAQTSEPNRPRV